MATQFSMLGIMNAALISQAFEEVLSENDGSDEYRLLSRNWPTIVEAELEAGAYHYARQQAHLVSRQPGAFGYDDAYLVPLDALHVRRVWTEDDSGVRDFPDWSQDGTRIHVNNPEGVFIEYVHAADPSFWGANFSMGVQMKLEAVLLRFREEYGAADRIDLKGDDFFSVARTMSSRSRSAKEPYREGKYIKAMRGWRRG